MQLQTNTKATKSRKGPFAMNWFAIYWIRKGIFYWMAQTYLSSIRITSSRKIPKGARNLQSHRHSRHQLIEVQRPNKMTFEWIDKKMSCCPANNWRHNILKVHCRRRGFGWHYHLHGHHKEPRQIPETASNNTIKTI